MAARLLAPVALVFVLLVAPTSRASAQSDDLPVDCPATVGEGGDTWARGEPLAVELENPYPGVYSQQCWYYGEGDTSGTVMFSIGWETAESEQSLDEFSGYCVDPGEFEDHDETRGTSGGINSASNRARVLWDGDAGLPEPPGEARNVAASLVYQLDNIAMPCDDSAAGAGGAVTPVPRSADGGVPAAVVIAGAGAVVALAGAAAGRTVRRKPRPQPASLADILAAEQMIETLTLHLGGPQTEPAAPPEPVPPAAPPRPLVDPEIVRQIERTAAYDEARRRRDEGLRQAELQRRIEARLAWGQWVAEWVVWGADRSIDALGSVSGPSGKLVKDVYTVTKRIGKGVGETVATGDRSRVLVGTIEGAYDLAWGKSFDKVKKLDKIPGWRDDSPFKGKAGASWGHMSVGNVYRGLNGTYHELGAMRGEAGKAVRAAANSWLRNKVVRDPWKSAIGF
jgi:hypothetical protein